MGAFRCDVTRIYLYETLSGQVNQSRVGDFEGPSDFYSNVTQFRSSSVSYQPTKSVNTRSPGYSHKDGGGSRSTDGYVTSCLGSSLGRLDR